MPTRNARRGEVVSYRRATTGRTTDVVVTGHQDAAPSDADVTLTPSITGGELAADDYNYRISVVVDGVETPASDTKAVTVGGTTEGSVEIDVTAVLAAYPRASSWKIYGRAAAAEELIDSVDFPTVVFTDTGEVVPDGVPVAATGAIAFRDRMAKVTKVQIPKATDPKSTGAYFKR